jgi:cytochrome c-type biogenesis protein CcmH
MNSVRIRVISLLLKVMIVLSLSLPATALEWQDVAADLMSPACPGRTLLNCTSGQAEQWRELIRQKLAQGETKEQILRYFVGIRGEEILAAPPKRGFALTAWLLPILVIINGAAVIVVLARTWTRKNSAKGESIPEADTIRLPEGKRAPDPYRHQLQQELEDFTS